MLEGGGFGFEVHDFLLEPHDRRPFPLEEAFVFGGGGCVEGGFGEGEVVAEGLGGLGVAAGGEVGDEGLVAVSVDLIDQRERTSRGKGGRTALRLAAT